MPTLEQEKAADAVIQARNALNAALKEANRVGVDVRGRSFEVSTIGTSVKRVAIQLTVSIPIEEKRP